MGDRGRHGIQLIDTGPYEMGELRELFGDVPLEQLAGGWVGCIVDSLSEFGASPGDIARTLIVVAERLHGVRFGSPVFFEGKSIMEQQPKNEAGFEVFDDDATPPQPKSGQRNDPLIDAIRALKPGQHIRIAESRIKRPALSGKVVKVKKETGRKDLRTYIAFNGDLVVTCDHAAEKPNEGPHSAGGDAAGRARRREAAATE